MNDFEGEVVRGPKGRVAIRFTTLSGIPALVDAALSPEVLAKFEQSLRRKMARTARAAARSAARSARNPGPGRSRR